MSKELKISKLQSEALRQLAEKSNVNGGKTLDKAEIMLFKGDAEYQALQAEVAKESDDIKKLLGYETTLSTKTEAQAVQPQAKAEDAQAKAEDAPAEAKKSPAEEVFDAYKRARGFDPENGGRLEGVPEKTVKAAYKEVEAKFQGKEYKQALKDLKDYAKHIDAQFVADAAIDGVTGETETGKVKSAAEEALKQRNDGKKMDKWEKHALHDTNNNVFARVLKRASGKHSDEKMHEIAVAARNRSAQKLENKYSQKDFEKAIGKTCPFVQQNIVNEDGKKVNALEAAGLIVDDGKGNYDITNLSAAVGRALGADYTDNREAHKGESETERVKDELRKAGVDVGKITDRDIRQLVRFCGYKVENKNVATVLWDATAGALLFAGATAATAATNPQHVVKIPVNVSQHVEVPIDLGSEQLAKDFMANLETNAELKAALGEAGSIVQTGAQVLVTVDQLVNLETIIKFSKNILTSAMKGAIIGAGLGLLKGLTDYGASEEGIFPTTLDCTTYEGMERVIDGRVADGVITEAQGLALKLLAVEFIQTEEKDGVVRAMTEKQPNGECEIVMDCNGFMKKLRDAAGNDKLNSIELASVPKKYSNPFEVKQLEKAPCDEPVTEPEKKPEDKYYNSGYHEVKKLDKFESWGTFATRYDCLEGQFNPKFKLGYNAKTKQYNPNSYARTMMKIMQAITDDNYDLERLQKLTEAAESGKFAELKSEKGFDYNLYKGLRGNRKDGSYTFDAQKIPTITRKDGNNEVVTCEARKQPLYKENTSGNGKAKRTSISGSEGGYVKSEDGQIDVKVTNKTDYAKAKNDAENQGYKKR